MDLSKFASNLKILSDVTLLKVILDLTSYIAFSQKYAKVYLYFEKWSFKKIVHKKPCLNMFRV